MAVNKSHPTADQCMDFRNVEQSQTVDSLNSGLLHRIYSLRVLHRIYSLRVLQRCGNGLSVGSYLLWTHGFDETGRLVFPQV